MYVPELSVFSQTFTVPMYSTILLREYIILRIFSVGFVLSNAGLERCWSCAMLVLSNAGLEQCRS